MVITQKPLLSAVLAATPFLIKAVMHSIDLKRSNGGIATNAFSEQFPASILKIPFTNISIT